MLSVHTNSLSRKFSRKLTRNALLTSLLLAAPSIQIYADPAGTESDPKVLTDSVYSLPDDGYWYTLGADISVYANNALLGYNGNGTGLIVSTGYTLSTKSVQLGYSSGKTGHLKVNGGTLNAQGDINVGNSGTGFCSVTNGGTVSAATCYLGSNSGTSSAGTLEVSGAGSNITFSASLVVGYGTDSTGTLTMSDGASISANSVTIGNTGTGSATLSGNGTKLTNHSYFVLSNGSAASLTVSNGAVFENTDGTQEFYVGAQTGSTTKTVTVTGAGSKITAAMTTYIGYQSSSTLNVSNGGVFSTTGSANYVGYLQATNASVANVTGAGSAWLNTGTLTLGSSSSGATGKLTIEDGALVTAKSLTVNTGSTLYIKGGFLALASTDATTNLTALEGYLDGGAVVYAYDPGTGQYVLVTSSNTSSLVKTQYFSDITTCTALSGYNLSGAYTVLTTGYTSWNAVPEPSTFAFAGGTAALLATMVIRRKKNAR
jgi:T5SS/PEP-CTERM-associated repeat protein